MYAIYIVKRTQIYLDVEQERQLRDRAREAGVTRSALIREAVAEYLAPSANEGSRMARFRAALDEVAEAPAALPPGAEYVEDLRAADRARDEAAEQRRS